MNLTADIGNTRAKLAVFDGDTIVAEVNTDHELTDLPTLAKAHPCRQGIVSTTAGLTETARERLQALGIPLLFMTGETAVPVQVHYRTRRTLGSDRLAAVVGAHHLHPENDMLVIDAGTCVTYDLIDHDGNYWGGNISPGMEMRLRALHQQTARLPQVGSEGDTPDVGYDTETAIRSGVVRGMEMEIEGYIRHFRKKYPALSVFLTGGDAQKFDMSAESCIFAPDSIVLRGLNQILAYNE
ncbi:MAG: type III pantothenate kinase [Bacteroidaceae bacterium]|nr:type III pantothenate kinase [Bacteroidaceae bacterium]